MVTGFVAELILRVTSGVFRLVIARRTRSLGSGSTSRGTRTCASLHPWTPACELAPTWPSTCIKPLSSLSTAVGLVLRGIGQAARGCVSNGPKKRDGAISGGGHRVTFRLQRILTRERRIFYYASGTILRKRWRCAILIELPNWSLGGSWDDDHST